MEDRDAVLVEAIGALSPGLMESFKEIEAESVRRGVSRCATYFQNHDLGMSLIVRWCGLYLSMNFPVFGHFAFMIFLLAP